MMQHSERLAFRAFVQDTLNNVDAYVAAVPGTQQLWEQFRVQLRAILTWTENDAIPEYSDFQRITVGNIALRELGETEEETPPAFQPLREAMMKIQHDVMNFHAPFP